MVLNNQIINEQMIHFGAAQDLAGPGIATIFGKSCATLAFLEARGGNCIPRRSTLGPWTFSPESFFLCGGFCIRNKGSHLLPIQMVGADRAHMVDHKPLARN